MFRQFERTNFLGVFSLWKHVKMLFVCIFAIKCLLVVESQTEEKRCQDIPVPSNKQTRLQLFIKKLLSQFLKTFMSILYD